MFVYSASNAVAGIYDNTTTCGSTLEAKARIVDYVQVKNALYR